MWVDEAGFSRGTEQTECIYIKEVHLLRMAFVIGTERPKDSLPCPGEPVHGYLPSPRARCHRGPNVVLKAWKIPKSCWASVYVKRQKKLENDFSGVWWQQTLQQEAKTCR